MLRKLALLTIGLLGITFIASGLTASDCLAEHTTKEIMKKVNGKMGLNAKLGDLGKAEKWDDATKVAKEFTEHAEALAKNKPSKGDAESWEKLTKKYVEDVKAVSDAVEKKDAKGVAEATKKFADNKNCGGCHSKHK